MIPMTRCRNEMLAVLFAATVAISAVPALAASVYRVDAASTAATPDGASWTTAYPTLQAAVDAADTDGGEVWVRKGIYTAATDAVLTMRPGVDLYGGFAGTETDRAQRDWNANPTTIDGQGARRCVMAYGAVLDGFVIAAGHAGLGGGMYFYDASPTVANCVFDSNVATVQGGGVYFEYAAPQFSACRFKGNHAPAGGGMMAESSTATLVNCVFQGNMAEIGAGLDLIANGSATATHCTFVGNRATTDGGAVCRDATSWTFTLKNSIVYANEAPVNAALQNGAAFEVSYSCIQGGWPGTGNIDADPQFLSVAGPLWLKDTSPCRDSADPATTLSVDIQGVARPWGAGYDMGAYEYTEVPVPDLANMTEADAGTTLAGLHLALGAVTKQCSNTVAAGLVISQNPAAGAAVPFGSTVALVVSTGVCNVNVPNLAGQTQTAAGTALAGAGLATGAVTQQCSNTVAAGLVISQNPAAGAAVPFGSTVALVVSTGVCNVNVPNLAGQTQTAAGTALAGAGLATGAVTQQCSNTVAAGLVISQNPAAGSAAPFGSAVSLAVSTGACNVNVPNLVGLSEEEARAAITLAGLVLGTVVDGFSSTVPEGEVLRQAPEAGMSVAPGSAVLIVVCRGIGTLMPNILGMTRDAAESAVRGALLVVGDIMNDFSDTVPAGQVLSQSPAGGVETARGVTVSFVVSLGQKTTVPDCAGMTLDQALAAMQTAGLLADVTEEASETVPEGQITRQQSAAGAFVPLGSTVGLTVSTGPDTGATGCAGCQGKKVAFSPGDLFLMGLSLLGWAAMARLHRS